MDSNAPTRMDHTHFGGSKNGKPIHKNHDYAHNGCSNLSIYLWKCPKTRGPSQLRQLFVAKNKKCWNFSRFWTNLIDFQTTVYCFLDGDPIGIWDVSNPK